MRQGREDELERFKTVISLAEYAGSVGYKMIRNESSSNSYVMQRDSDNDKIIVATAEDGHGIYFSVRDDLDNGSIIDFVQHRKSLNLGQVRQELRPWVGARPSAVQSRTNKPKPSTTDRQQVFQVIARSTEAAQHPYLLSRGIDSATLMDVRFVGSIRRDNRGNALFPHYDRSGLSGYEVKNKDFTGFASGGTKSIWFTSNIERSDRLVVVESAIDALSHAAAVGRAEDSYASFGGSMSPEQLEILKDLLRKAHKEGRTLVIATDKDASGDRFDAQLRSLAAPGMKIERDAPKHGNDWNETLKHYIERPREWRSECISREASWPRHDEGSSGWGTNTIDESPSLKPKGF